MLLTVDTAPVITSGVTAVWTVPGDQQWRLQSVYCVMQTGAGGTPFRFFQLSVTDGTNTVAQVSNADGPTDPGTVNVTWANAPAASESITGFTTSIAPIPNLVLNPGYVLEVDIFNSQPGDQILTAAAWYDFVPTGGG